MNKAEEFNQKQVDLNKKLVEHCENAEIRLAKIEKMAKIGALKINDGPGSPVGMDETISANEMWDAAHPKVHKSRAQMARESS